MNYRHIFHAGNFSDVIKHYILTLCLNKLRQKTSPFCIIDTHAGIGHYDLQSTLAQKTKEYVKGIQPLLNAQGLDPSFNAYLDVVRAYNPELPTLQFYPGSPLIARHFLRVGDRMLLSELHPIDAENLNDLFKRDSLVKVLNQDAYISLKSLLPPKEKRGLILIDPPFEKRDEFNALIKGLREAISRFAHGMYLIWFPIKDPLVCEDFYESLHALSLPKTLLLEFFIHKPLQTNVLNGCGIIMINPPWQIDTLLKHPLKQLEAILTQKQGYSHLRWLVGES